jgi:hypothetical protein
VSGVILPELAWKPSGGYSQRHGSRIARVVVHRWGERIPVSELVEAALYAHVVTYLRDSVNRASAHVVMPGSIVPGQAAQLVKWSDFAWTEAAYNPTSVEVECADAIWVPDEHGVYDETGFEVTARIVAFLLASGGGLRDPAKRVLPPVWSHERGFCRHADLGVAGGDHPNCPTTDLARWRHFCSRVEFHFALGGFRPLWGVR